MNNGFVMYPTNKKQLKLLKIKDKLEESSIQKDILDQKHEPATDQEFCTTSDGITTGIMFQSSDLDALT